VAMDVLGDMTPTKVGVSLGSFSVSAAILTALNKEFAAELEAKSGKFDTDPHWWMPFTQPKASYVKLMEGKGTPAEEADAHFERMAAFKAAFVEGNPGPHGAKVFGAVGIGPSTGEDKPYWWDYGQLAYYKKYNILATEDSVEAGALRKFLQVPARVSADSNVAEGVVDAKSCVIASTIKEGEIKESLLAKCNIPECRVTDSVLVNVTAKKVVGKGLVLYNVCDDSEEGLVYPDDSVRADVFLADVPKVTMRSSLSNPAHDGGKAWKETLEGNTHSFEGVHTANQSEDVVAVGISAAKAHADVGATL